MTDIEQRPPRSGFVTGIAWTFIILGGFATLIAILQNIMISVMLPADEMREAFNRPGAEAMPAFARFMVENFRLFFIATLTLSAVSFAAGIGLLKRKNWARITVNALLALGIIWNLAGLIIPFVIFPSFPPIPANAPAGFGDSFETMTKVMMGFMVVITIVFSVLFAWTIKRLCAADIRREFGVE